MSKKPVIVIPSKHIYDYQWSPVINNQIDTIEVPVKRVEPDNQFNIPVHNERLSLDEKFGGGGGIQQDYNLDGRVGNQIVTIALAGVQLIPTYVKGRVIIPRQMDISHRLDRLLLGVDKGGFNNIGLRLSGDVFRGITSNTLTYSNPNHYNYLDKRNFDFDWDNTYFERETTNQGSYTIDTTHSYSVSYKMSALDTLTSSITMTLDNQDNLATVTATETKQNYIIDVVVLCGLKVVKLGCTFTHKSSADKEVVPMSGLYEEYVPNLCELTFYGNTIGIKLVEEIVRIGGNSNRVATRQAPKVQTNQLVAQYTIDLTDKPKVSTLQAPTTPKLKSWNDYYDDESEKETYNYKLAQAQPKLEEFYKQNDFEFWIDDYRNYQKEIENIIGFKYKKFFEPIMKENVDLSDKYIGETKEDYSVVETENGKSVVGVQIVPTYVNKTIKIPTFIDNEEVVQWAIGIDNKKCEEDKQAVVRLYGIVNKGKATNKLTNKANEVSFNWADTEYEQQETSYQDYKYLDRTQEYSIDNGTMIELELDSEQVTVNSHKTENYITTVDLTILCGLKVTKLGASFNGKKADMDGIYEEFIPTMCELTIYGNTVALKL